MLKLRAAILQSSIYYFSSSLGQRDRKLTQHINAAKSTRQVMNLITKNKTTLNIVHISTALKKLNMNLVRDKQILDTIYKQVKRCLQKNYEPNDNNSRALANIIGYTGNRDYLEINQSLKKINVLKLSKLVNQKQFAMLITGLLKLNLIEETIGDQKQSIIEQFVHKCYFVGLLISLWRNLIKYNQCSENLNNLLIQKILKCHTTPNLKDFGYLIYCYISSPYIKQENIQLSKFVRNCSQNVLFTTRINMFELCIFLDHLVELRKFVIEKPNEQFIFVLRNQYIRIVKGLTELRSLANGYMSMTNFQFAVDPEIVSVTAQRFLFLLKNQSQTQDFQSVTSLFLQLMTTKSVSQLKQDPILNTILREIKHIFFNKENQKLLKLNDKQFQKLLYTLFICKKSGLNVSLNSQQLILIGRLISERSQFNDIQINSITASLTGLNLKNILICKTLKEKYGKILQNLKKSQCVLGLKSQSCLNCLKCDQESIKK